MEVQGSSCRVRSGEPGVNRWKCALERNRR